MQRRISRLITLAMAVLLLVACSADEPSTVSTASDGVELGTEPSSATSSSEPSPDELTAEERAGELVDEDGLPDAERAKIIELGRSAAELSDPCSAETLSCFATPPNRTPELADGRFPPALAADELKTEPLRRADAAALAVQVAGERGAAPENDDPRIVLVSYVDFERLAQNQRDASAVAATDIADNRAVWIVEIEGDFIVSAGPPPLDQDDAPEPIRSRYFGVAIDVGSGFVVGTYGTNQSVLMPR